MAISVNDIITNNNKPMCEYNTRYTGTLHLYEKLGDYLVLYRPNLNNVGIIVLTHTGEFTHAAHVYETVQKQMAEIEKGLALISQTVRTYVAEHMGGYVYQRISDSTSYRTAICYDKFKEGLDNVVAPLIEQCLTYEEPDNVGEE